MKTTLIQIDPHDDLTSIKDKMTWSQSPRMLLFFPRGYPLEQSPLTLKLIRRYAASLGARVALITRSRAMRAIAEEQGIPCFASAPQAEKRSWPVLKVPAPRGEVRGAEKLAEIKTGLGLVSLTKTKTRVNIQRVIAYLLLVLLMLLGAVVFIPKATVVVYPVFALQRQSYQVYADPAAIEVSLTGNLPAQTLTIEVQGELSADSSGNVTIPKTKAIGEVEIKNLTSRSLILPKGTIVSTAGDAPIEFYLTSEALLSGDVNNTVLVGVEAVLAGESGNVDSGMITRAGGLESVISVENLTPTSGGTQQSFPTPLEEDYRKLEARLKVQLLAQCKEKLSAQQLDGMMVVAESTALGETLSFTQIPKSGEPSDRATLSMGVSCSALTVSTADEERLAALILDETLASGVMPVGSALNIEKTSPVTLDANGLFTWTENASRVLMPAWDQEKFIRLLSGKRVSVARAALQAVFLQPQDPAVQVWPGWWNLMPILPGRISVEVRGE